jgi:endonuclease I
MTRRYSRSSLLLLLFINLANAIDSKKSTKKILDGDTHKSVDDYYSNINFNAKDDELKKQLHDLINPHIVYDYDEVWNAFLDVDHYLPTYPCDVNTSYIPDIYSSYCWIPEKITGGECGNYKKEGDCYNREHLWPKSWFGGFDYGANAQTDLFELWPSDGYVNGLRGDIPFGYVLSTNITYKSSNGCLIGQCDPQYTQGDLTIGKCFEPSLQYKGDFARTYFYLSTAYYQEWNCCETTGTNNSSIKLWMETILRSWHQLDPVDEFEKQRNNCIYEDWQLNRNPFIDYPQFVDQISDF